MKPNTRLVPLVPLFLLFGCSSKSPTDVHVEINETYSASFSRDKWRLVSFPLQPVYLNALLGQYLLPPDSILVFSWESGQYRFRPDALYPGAGYWLYMENEDIAIHGNMSDFFQGESLKIVLRRGRNLIGNPFITDIDLPDASLRYLYLPDSSAPSGAAGMASAKLDTAAFMEPWKGYFVDLATDSLEIILRK